MSIIKPDTFKDTIMLQRIISSDTQDAGKLGFVRDNIFTVKALIENVSTRDLIRLGREDSLDVKKVTMINIKEVNSKDKFGFEWLNTTSDMRFYRFVSTPEIPEFKGVRVNPNMFITMFAECEGELV